jgi:hypothetical protein
MAFTPENDLERTMLRAASDPAERPAFYRLLLSSELVALGEFGRSLVLDIVENRGRKYHPVFTSRCRLDAFTPEPMPSFTIPAHVLFESTRGAAFVLNPGSELVKELTPDEIAGAIRLVGEPSVVFTQPDVYPTRLIKALCVLYTSRSQLKAARLAYITRRDETGPSHPVIGIETDGEAPHLAGETIAAAQEVMPNTPVDVVYLDPKRTTSAFHQHLLGVPPFYRRSFALN